MPDCLTCTHLKPYESVYIDHATREAIKEQRAGCEMGQTPGRCGKWEARKSSGEMVGGKQVSEKQLKCPKCSKQGSYVLSKSLRRLVGEGERVKVCGFCGHRWSKLEASE